MAGEEEKKFVFVKGLKLGFSVKDLYEELLVIEKNDNLEKQALDVEKLKVKTLLLIVEKMDEINL